MRREITARMRLSTGALAMAAFTGLLAGCNQQSGGTIDRSVAAPLTPSHVALKSDTAPTVKIISGELVFDRTQEIRWIELKGTQGFRFSARFLMPAFSPEYQCRPCVPGDTVPLDAHIAGTDLDGTVSFHGNTYPMGMLDSEASAALIFRGQGVTMPAFSTAQTVTLSAPFELVETGEPVSSLSTLFIVGERPVRLSGQGIATLDFQKFSGPDPGTHVWETTRAVYQFR